jgi:RHS repeat-associated protein
VSGSTTTKYYYAGGQRIAMRQGTTLYYLLGDHPSTSLRAGLGSTSITTDAGGNKIAELRYKAWGEVRYNRGSTPIQYTYTGQYSQVSEFGLLFYQSRWMDPSLGRFAQADTVVPGGVQGLDRYAYVNNNPLNYTDPSGHTPADKPEGVVFALTVDLWAFVQIYRNMSVEGNLSGWVAPGSYYSQKIFYNGKALTGLCGDVSLAAVLQMRMRVTANDVVRVAYENDIDPDYLNFTGLANLVKAFPGYSAYYCNATGGGACSENKDQSRVYKSQALSFMRNVISGGDFLIARVYIDPSSGYLQQGGAEHWVVMNGISEDGLWVSIYNPFNNEIEYYPTWQFNDNWFANVNGVEAGLMVVVVPQPQYRPRTLSEPV